VEEKWKEIRIKTRKEKKEKNRGKETASSKDGSSDSSAQRAHFFGNSKKKRGTE